MASVTAFEAKIRFGKLIERVTRGPTGVNGGRSLSHLAVRRQRVVLPESGWRNDGGADRRHWGHTHTGFAGHALSYAHRRRSCRATAISIDFSGIAGATGAWRLVSTPVASFGSAPSSRLRSLAADIRFDRRPTRDRLTLPNVDRRAGRPRGRRPRPLIPVNTAVASR